MVLPASARSGASTLSRFCRSVPSSLRPVRPQPPTSLPPPSSARPSSRLPSLKKPFPSPDPFSSLRRITFLDVSLPMSSCTMDSAFPLHPRAWTFSRVSATDDLDGT